MNDNLFNIKIIVLNPTT